MITKAHELTIDKLERISKSLEECLKIEDWDTAESQLALLRDYKNCYYCVEFRKSLEIDRDGVCGDCPCHKLGVELLGRPRTYNGCYLVRNYRDAVRDSHWFLTERSKESVAACIRSVNGLLEFMKINKGKLGG